MSNGATKEDETYRNTKYAVLLANPLTVNKTCKVLKADLSPEICFNYFVHL